MLLAADGVGTVEIAKQLGVSPPTVCKWRQRAARSGGKGLADAKRTGRPRTISEEARLGLIAVACEPLTSEGGRTTPTLDEIRDRAVARDVVVCFSMSVV